MSIQLGQSTSVAHVLRVSMGYREVECKARRADSGCITSKEKSVLVYD